MKHLQTHPDPEKLLSTRVIITQKIDGSALIVRKENEKVKYFGRDGKREIDLVTRTTMDLYEDGIEYLQHTEIETVVQKNGQEIAFEYFPAKAMPVIPIVRRPKNNLVLLHTNIGDPKKLADKLNVEAPPVLFDGTLNDTQKTILLSGHFTSKDVKHFNKDFNLLINPEKNEGIVVKTREGMYKVTDKNFTQQIKQKKQSVDLKKQSYYNEILQVLLVDLNIDVPMSYSYSPKNFLTVLWDNIRKQQQSLISKHEKRFAKYEYGHPFIADFVDVNWKMIPKDIAKEMQKRPWWKDFVRMSLQHLSKKKTRATSMFSKQMKDEINKKMEPLLEGSTRL